MSKRYPGLVIRGNFYYVRKRVPKELITTIGRKEISMSLKTSSLEEAKRSDWQVMKELEERFQTHRNRLARQNERQISPHQAEQLASDFYEKNSKERLFKIQKYIGDRESMDVVRQNIEEEEDYFRNGPDTHVVHFLIKTGREILRESGYAPAGSSSPESCVDDQSWLRLMQAIRIEHIGFLRHKLEVLDGNPVRLRDGHRAQGVLRSQWAELGAKTDNLTTVEELYDEFLRDPPIQLSAREALNRQASFRVLFETIGKDRPVNDLSHDDFNLVLNLLKKLPKNFSKIASATGKSLQQTATENEANSAKFLSARTVNKYMRHILAVMEWAEGTGKIRKNPSNSKYLKAQPSKDAAPEKGRYPFSIEQLNALFQSTAFKEPNSNRPSMYWLPLLALFHGFRMEEMLQIRASDVASTKDGIAIFNLHATQGNSLKTMSSARQVPIHSYMFELGFQTLLDNAQQRSDRRLFYDVPISKTKMRYQPIFTARFARYLEKQGLKTDKVSFHSFRHNFRDAGRDAQIPEDRVRKIGGWSLGETVADSYGQGAGINALKKSIERIVYPEVDFSSIKSIKWS